MQDWRQSSMSFSMGYNLIIFSGQWLTKFTQDHFRTSLAVLHQLGYGTSILLATKATDKKEEEQCCHCNQPNLTIRFLNDVPLDNPGIQTLEIHIYNGKQAERNINSVSSHLCASAMGYNSVEKQSQLSVMSCRCSKVTLEIGGRYFRCLL